MGKRRNKSQAVLRNVQSENLQNGLAEVIGYGGRGIDGFNGLVHGMHGLNGGYGGGGSQVAQSDTMFKNLRNYLISNMRQLLSQAYVEIGLVQTVVDVPVDDALRGGVTIKTKQLDEQDVIRLNTIMEREGDLDHVAEAAKWKRLFGGSAILILTDQDPETELDLEAIEKDSFLEFRAIDMWELFWDRQGQDGDETTLEVGESLFECYNYYGELVHKSRVIKMKGKKPPSFLRGRLRGWGFSEIETLLRSVNQYLKATDLSFEVLDEFKLDIFKFKDLATTLMMPGGQGDAAVQKRIAVANHQKNYQNAIVMDKEDDYDHKQLSFAGLAEAMQGIRTQVASDLRIPITKLFGISATGFNSGEDDIEVYNSMVESSIRSRLKYDILRVIEIRCQKEFGFIPDDLTIEFKPLRILSAEQEENIKEKKYNRIAAAKAANEITTLEYRDAVNRGNLFDIQLDTTSSELLPEDADTLQRDEDDLEGLEDDEDEGDPDEDETNASESKSKKTSAKSEDRIINAEFKESDHPRAADGKFGSGGKSKEAKPKKKVGINDPNFVDPMRQGATTKVEEHGRGYELEKAAYLKKYPQQGGDNWPQEFHSGGYTKADAIAKGRELRAKGIFASVAHVEGPATGPKSKYGITVPKENIEGSEENKKLKEEKAKSDSSEEKGFDITSGDDGHTVKRKASITDAEVKQFLGDAKTKEVFKSIESKNPELKNAINEWSRAAYVGIRQLQQKGKIISDPKTTEEKAYMAMIDSFHELPSYDGPLVRDLSIELSEVQNLFKAGETFTIDAFSSFTARDRYASMNRKVRMVVEKNTQGKAVWGLSSMPEEVEVIVPKGTKYEITRIEEQDDKPYFIIHVKEVG